MLKVLVVDDEALARERLKRMIEKNEDYQVIAEAAHGEQALDCCAQHQPDIVLMDIRMPGMDGLAAARAIVEMPEAPALIFCTAYGEYALEAFDVAAVGYLLKPVNQQKLQTALDQAQRLSRAQINALGLTSDAEKKEQAPGGRQHLSTTRRGEVVLIPLDTIQALYADQKYVTAYHTGGEALLEESLKGLESEFADHFVRVHRNALVAVKAIEALERSDGGFVLKLTDCAFKPQVSRRHLTSIRKFLQLL